MKWDFTFFEVRFQVFGWVGPAVVKDFEPVVLGGGQAISVGVIPYPRYPDICWMPTDLNGWEYGASNYLRFPLAVP